MKNLYPVAVFAVLVSAISFLLSDFAQAREPLPIYTSLQPFTFTDSNGNELSPNQLEGKVWTVNFFFSRCPVTCPKVTGKLRELQQALPTDPGLRFVSLSIDPENDTAAVLEQFKKRYGAEQSDWIVATGTEQALDEFLRRDALLDSPQDKGMHTTRILLIDRSMRIRGYYPALDDGAIERLAADIKSLLLES